MKGEEIYDIGEAWIPEGVQILKKQTSYCIVAKRDFAKGQLVFDLRICWHVPKETDKLRISIRGVQYICDKQHTIQYDDYRYFPGFCCYMNHACQANTLFVKNKQNKLNSIGTELEEGYALRDIKKGEELTCNYLYFFYDGEESEKFTCACGSPKCYKQIQGFKYLSLQDQISFLPILYSQVKQMWLRENNSIKVIDSLQIPKGLLLNDNNEYLISQKEYKKGQIVYNYLPYKLLKPSIIIVKKGDIYHKIKEEELLGMPDNSLNYLSIFTKKSDQPNIKVSDEGKNKVGTCIRNIGIGEYICEEYVN